MLQIFLALFLGLACPSNTHKACHNKGTVVTTLADDTGGETGHIPPTPTPPPPTAG
jgi:hypothetical protein